MQEIEATLIICSDTPLTVLDSVAALPSIGGYSLQPQKTVSIHDYYLDTPEQALHQINFNLRLRQVDSVLWLTMKGRPTNRGPGIEGRREVEISWSEESLNCISQELADNGVVLASPPSTDQGADPWDRLPSRGLEFIQHRQNCRQIRHILADQEHGHQVLAELSLDSVIYHFREREIRHYEVEIEAKSELGVSLLPSLAQELADTHPSTLQLWDHGKLSTGKAIESLLVSGELDRLLGVENNLIPAAYPVIHHLLSHSRD